MKNINFSVAIKEQLAFFSITHNTFWDGANSVFLITVIGDY